MYYQATMARTEGREAISRKAGAAGWLLASGSCYIYKYKYIVVSMLRL